MRHLSSVRRLAVCSAIAVVAAGFTLAITAGGAFAGTLPAGTGYLASVSCPSGGSFCAAVGAGAVVSTDGGAVWNTSPIPSGSWSSVSCLNATDCTAVGQDSGGTNGLIETTTDGGTTWHQVLSTAGASYSGVSCQPSGCLAVGTTFAPTATPDVAATSGGPWASMTPPAGASTLSAVSCSDALHCWATGSAGNTTYVYATPDGGQTWTRQTLAAFPGAPTQQDASEGIDFVDAAHGFVALFSNGCGGPGVIGCGGGVESTSDGGAHWAVSEFIGNGPNSVDISCVDALHCVDVGNQVSGAVIQVTSDGGAHWAQQGPVLTTMALRGVSCPSGGACVEVGQSKTGSAGMTNSSTGPGGTPGGPPSCIARGFNPPPSGVVARIAGTDRDGTAIAISKAGFPSNGSAKAVVVASDANYPDALAGSPLAVAKTAPLLLTAQSGLTPAVSAEITRVAPKGSTVYLLGGPNALSATTESQVTALGDTPQRIQGPNRFATAVAIAGALGDPSNILEATGVNFPDALGAGAAAAKASGAVLLTNGSTQAAETSAYLAAHSSDTRTAVGGPAAAADGGATPLVGSDRYATAVLVAQHFFPGPTVLGLASGATFPDALSGGANIGAASGPMLLAPACGALPASLTNYLGSVKGSVASGSLYGGTSAVGDDVLQELESAA